MQIDSVSQTGANNFDTMDLSSLMMMVLGQRTQILDANVREQAAAVEASNQQILAANQLSMLSNLGQNNMEVSSSSLQTYSEAGAATDFSQPTQLDNGDTFIDFGDGYGVVASSTGNREWSMVEYDPAAAKDVNGDPVFTSETRIWGDPHVDEGNDGRTDWDFYQQSTFVMPNGVSVTVETAPFGNSGATVSDNLYISRGDSQAVVKNLADNAGGLDREGKVDTFEVVNDASLFNEAEHNDGHIFTTKDGNLGDWQKLDGVDLTGGAKTAETTINNEVEVIPANAANIAMLEKAGLNPDDYKSGDTLVLTTANIEAIDTAMDSVFSIEATEENLAALEMIGFEVSGNTFGNMLVFSAEETSALSATIKDFVDSKTSMSQMELIDLQSTMDKYGETLDLLTNFLSKYAGKIDAVTGNIR